VEIVHPAYVILGVVLVVIVYTISYFYYKDKKTWNGGKCKRCGTDLIRYREKGKNFYHCSSCGYFINTMFLFKQKGEV